MSYTTDEQMVVCIARQVQNGDTLAQGLSTPLVAAGYLLAWHTHAPEVYFASAIGQSICRSPAPLGLASVEGLWLRKPLTSVGFVQAACDLLPCILPMEWFRPGQVDPHGNFNNLAIGRDAASPRLRLPGSGGIPDVTVIFDKTYLYVPRHGRATFVPRLDHRSGLGHGGERVWGRGACYLVSDLGQFDFANGRLRLISLHAGVDRQRAEAKTGFPIEVLEPLPPTPPPTDEELDVLRRLVDPLGIRRLEFLGGPARRDALISILAAEQQSQAGETFG
jgi:acyl CoA:acetate/3-ketoacid CoA transferase beta subunit